MSTKKHFIAAAAYVVTIPEKFWREETAHVLADVFARQNPRFDREKFLKACGVQP